MACRLSKLQPVLCAPRLGRIGKCDGMHAPVCLFPRREERCRIACAAYDKLRSIRDTISVANGGQIDTLFVPRERLSAPAIVLEYSCWLGCIKQSQWLKKKVQMSSLNHAPPAHNNSVPSSLGLMQAPSGFPLSRFLPPTLFCFHYVHGSTVFSPSIQVQFTIPQVKASIPVAVHRTPQCISQELTA